jgi:DNA (cytosine-5)-methyltransferase 1
MRYLDLFCGAGGLTLGLQQAGWECAGALDHSEDALETYHHNFASHPTFLDNISSFALNIPRATRDVDWVVGGPPCQGFSTVGKRLRNDPRNALVQEFAKIVDEIRPQGFLVENVVGLRDMDFVESVRELFEASGYAVSTMVLKAADFGVPQLRHRIFFVGRRDGLFFTFPRPTHDIGAYINVWDAIGDLPEIGAGESATKYDQRAFSNYQRQLRRGSRVLQGHVASAHPATLVKAISYIPDGGNRQSIPPRYQPRSGFHNSYSRLSSRAPAVAVTQNMGKPSGSRCIHPFQNRGLTAREGARLQGFPDTFHFLGGITSQRLQVANAVSPILASVLARELANPERYSRVRQIDSDQLALISLLAS